MKRWVALAPAYPPLRGEPMMAAPLLITITRLPGRSGSRSISRSQWNVIWTSVFQFLENESQVCCWRGRSDGAAPATRATMLGLYWRSSVPATAGSLPSAASICNRVSRAASSISGLGSRARASTDAPSARNASVTPLPSPRLAPTTIARLSASWFTPISLIEDGCKTAPEGSVHEAAHSLLEAVEHPRGEACQDQRRESEPEHGQVGVRLRPAHRPRNRPSELGGARKSTRQIRVEGDAKGRRDLDRVVVRRVIAPEPQHAATIGVEQEETRLHSRQGEARYEWADHAGDIAPRNDA